MLKVKYDFSNDFENIEHEKEFDWNETYEAIANKEVDYYNEYMKKENLPYTVPKEVGVQLIRHFLLETGNTDIIEKCWEEEIMDYYRDEVEKECLEEKADYDLLCRERGY